MRATYQFFTFHLTEGYEVVGEGQTLGIALG